jgi:hypothetical protein
MAKTCIGKYEELVWKQLVEAVKVLTDIGAIKWRRDSDFGLHAELALELREFDQGDETHIPYLRMLRNSGENDDEVTSFDHTGEDVTSLFESLSKSVE